MCGAHSTVRGVLKEIPTDYATVVVDLEASPEHFTRATSEFLDAMVLVAEPYFKSMETARRYHDLAADLGITKLGIVANKVGSGDDAILPEFCAAHGYRLLGSVPFDPAFAEAERRGEAPIDTQPDSPGIAAITALAEEVTEA